MSSNPDNITLKCQSLRLNFINENANKMQISKENKSHQLSVSSNINEVIRSVLNFLFFFTKRCHKFKEAQNRLQRTKIKMCMKNIQVVI